MNKKLVGISIACMCLALANPVTSMAQPQENMLNQPVTMDEVWYEEYMENGDCFYFPVEITKPGKLEAKLQAFLPCYVEFLNDDYIRQDECFLSVATENDPRTWEAEYCLVPGTYYFKFSAIYGKNGNFRMKAKFTDLEINETEPNDVYKDAQLLSENTEIRGMFSLNDVYDYYRIEVTEKSDIDLIIKTDKTNATAEIYDEDLLLIDRVFIQGGIPAEEYENTFEPGTYYIKLQNYNETQGYTIKYNQ